MHECNYNPITQYISARRAPWHTGKQKRKAINHLLRHPAKNGMKVPIGWPNVTRVFSKDYEKLKLAEVLAFLGGTIYI